MWKRFVKGWKAFWHPVGKVQTIILLSVLFFVILPFFSPIRFKDPLRKRLGGPSFWIKRKPVVLDLERHHFPF
ncbi:MAG: hypothetical protein HYR85_12480 [Planctomycetes bacterium]|nr:hypothetical protein [Planctomycetota bacterium]MBI3845609.1 hypothetical protein [Planctomycetota bacterium]